MMFALNDLASQVTTGTMKTEEVQACFLSYCATNPDTSIVYHTSDMTIRENTDAAYCVASKARRRNAAYIFMGNKDRNNQTNHDHSKNTKKSCCIGNISRVSIIISCRTRNCTTLIHSIKTQIQTTRNTTTNQQ